LLSKYKIVLTKEMTLELSSEIEAKQITDIIADRETINSFIGNNAVITCDYKLVENV